MAQVVAHEDFERHRLAGVDDAAGVTRFAAGTDSTAYECALHLARASLVNYLVTYQGNVI